MEEQQPNYYYNVYEAGTNRFIGRLRSDKLQQEGNKLNVRDGDETFLREVTYVSATTEPIMREDGKPDFARMLWVGDKILND